MDDGTVLELDGDRLIVEFHQKSTTRWSQHSSCADQTPYIHRHSCAQYYMASAGRDTYLTSFIVGDQVVEDDEDEDEHDEGARCGSKGPRSGDRILTITL